MFHQHSHDDHSHHSHHSNCSDHAPKANKWTWYSAIWGAGASAISTTFWLSGTLSTIPVRALQGEQGAMFSCSWPVFSIAAA